MPDFDRLRAILSERVATAGVADAEGAIQYQTATEAEAAGDVAFAGPVADFILYGVVNGAFAQGPPDPASNIEPVNNPLPYWTGPIQVSGGAITCTWVTDSASPSGHNLRFTIAPGAAGDEAYFEQIVPIGGTRAQHMGHYVRASKAVVSKSGANDPVGTGNNQYLTVTGATTGTAWGGNINTAVPPTDAYYLRIRIGVRRDTMAAGDSAIMDYYNVRVDKGTPTLVIPDGSSAPTELPAQIYQSAAYLYLGTDSFAGRVVPGGTLTILEQASPLAPPSGKYAIYAKTDGILYGKNDAGTEVALGGGGAKTVIRPSISGTVNDWAPSGLAADVVILADLNSANRTITGISALADGAMLYLMAQSSTNTITLSHLSGSSSAANQFRCPAGVDYTIGNKAGATIVYDATDQKWRVVGPA